MALKNAVFASSDFLNFAPFARRFFHCIRHVSCFGFVVQFTLVFDNLPLSMAYKFFNYTFRSRFSLKSIDRFHTPQGQNRTSSSFRRRTTINCSFDQSVVRGSLSFYSKFDYTKAWTCGFYATNSCPLSIFLQIRGTRFETQKQKCHNFTRTQPATGLVRRVPRKTWIYSRTMDLFAVPFVGFRAQKKRIALKISHLSCYSRRSDYVTPRLARGDREFTYRTSTLH